MRRSAPTRRPPPALAHEKTAGPSWPRLLWQRLRPLLLFAALVGLSKAAQAKGQPKTWAPPIPPGRAAITLSVRTVNAENTKVPAKVMWGRRLLGETPLRLQWPADSGPVDIVVLAPGHVPVHTRLYTFADDKVVVKLVDDEGKKTLFGYKREVPAATPATAAPTAAAPAAPAATAAAPASPAPGGPSPALATPPAAPASISPPAGTQ